jgi:hypothetical protein
LTVFWVSSFQSLWYWILHVVVWTLVTHRTLGVPYDMILRGRRLPEVAGSVEVLARIHAARAVGLYHSVGVFAASIAGFALAGLFTIGFVNGIEFAQAAFLILFPLAAIAYSALTLALVVLRNGLREDALLRLLGRRHFWHQIVAVTAMFVSLAVAVLRHPRLLEP